MLSPSVVVSSAARTASGTSSSADVRDQLERGIGTSQLNVLVDVTAASGTGPTLDLEVEWSNDGTTWASAETADTFTQITAATTVSKRFTVKASHYRIKWTVGGTAPSFTFSVSVLETP
jgi:hypothetical protein